MGGVKWEGGAPPPHTVPLPGLSSNRKSPPRHPQSITRGKETQGKGGGHQITWKFPLPRPLHMSGGVGAHTQQHKAAPQAPSHSPPPPVPAPRPRCPTGSPPAHPAWSRCWLRLRLPRERTPTRGEGLGTSGGGRGAGGCFPPPPGSQVGLKLLWESGPSLPLPEPVFPREFASIASPVPSPPGCRHPNG